MENKNHVITSHNIEQEVQKSTQSDVVIHNKLGNCETCLGLRHWRLLFNLKNNFSRPVRNDMGRHPEGTRAEDDVKNVKNLFPYFPISFSLKKKVDSSRSLRMTAFTLAEVLITLGIIGVVAAMTIPGLINNYKAQRLRSQFLKSYSTVQQAFKLMQEDDVSMDPTTYDVLVFYKTFMKYLQAPTDCGIRYNTTAPCYYTRGNNPKTYKTFANKPASTIFFDDGQIALQDGTLLLFENYHNGRIYISVDLNGVSNPPNRWGYDLFTFQFIDEELKVMGDIGTDYTDMTKFCDKNSSEEFNGIACAKYAKDNSDYFKSVVKEFK